MPSNNVVIGLGGIWAFSKTGHIVVQFFQSVKYARPLFFISATSFFKSL